MNIDLTEVEKDILTNLDANLKWVARNTDGYMYLFVNKPRNVIAGYWKDRIVGGNTNTNFDFPFRNMFENIVYSDSPYLIEGLLEIREENYGKI